MPVLYEYLLTVQLAEDSPPEIIQFFSQLAEGSMPDALPYADERSLEVAPREVVRLLGGEQRSVQMAGRQVTLSGAAPADQFYMPFLALAEWLARWSTGAEFVGYYRERSTLHPTLLYFSDGRPYMLQTVGTPVGLVDGQPLPQAGERLQDEETE